MSTKWYKFKEQYDTAPVSSPIQVAKVSTGDSNIVGDWNRMGAINATIDGERIIDLVRKDKGKEVAHDNLFENEEELKTFFRKHLLKNVKEKDQDQALEQMLKTMHQGGLQAPVTSALYEAISEASNNMIGLHSSKDEKDNSQIRELNFKTTNTGFKVQEISTQKALTKGINYGDDAGDQIVPDKGFDYVLKAKATIDIDFSKDPSSPTLTIENNTISFGSKEAEKHLYSKGWLEKFLDKLCNAVGWYRKEQVSSIDKNTQEKNDNESDEEKEEISTSP